MYLLMKCCAQIGGLAPPLGQVWCVLKCRMMSVHLLSLELLVGTKLLINQQICAASECYQFCMS